MPEKNQRLKMRLKPAAETLIRGGHPWIFSGSIRDQSRPGAAGEIAIVYDRQDRFLALGLFDPDSPIRVRVLHRGKPKTLDDSWWRENLRNAVSKRAELFDANTTGYRLIHGENDGWPGLILDRYDDSLVLKIYTAAWFPWVQKIAAWLEELVPCERIVLRLSRNIHDAGASAGWPDAKLLKGVAPENPVLFRENGIVFEADILRGQKTGFFLDQRENRSRVESLSSGRSVLNAFSFSGGFSLYAARGGASAVTSLDISEHALESARRNFSYNRDSKIQACEHHAVKADVFEWLKTSRETFSLIILDPPALAKSRAEVETALAAYEQLARFAFRLIKPQGIVVAASCSAQVPAEDFFQRIREAARHERKTIREITTTRQPPDHPATFPEMEYLKAIYLEVP
jgi:23S rRNA (cytosine1962-C5)-methyltransferase